MREEGRERASVIRWELQEREEAWGLQLITLWPWPLIWAALLMTHRDIIDWRCSSVHITDSCDEQLQTLSPSLFVSRVKQTFPKSQLTKYGRRPIFLFCLLVPVFIIIPWKVLFSIWSHFPTRYHRRQMQLPQGKYKPQTSNIHSALFLSHASCLCFYILCPYIRDPCVLTMDNKWDSGQPRDWRCCQPDQPN